MTTPSILGLDIGGANLKAARVGDDVECRTRPFPLWRDPAGLTAALTALVADLPPADALAVTMTGELCDCFASKTDGVRHILDAVETLAANRPIHVWTTHGDFVAVEIARTIRPLSVAAANWLALATWAGRLVPTGPALLLDIGSTTTDIIALSDGKPLPQGRDDCARLTSGELVYRGVRRTPVCALTLPEEAVAAELFATTLDVFLVLDDCAEDVEDTDTSDGRPATRRNALARLNRMFCQDNETLDEAALVAFAEQLRQRLVALLVQAVDRRIAALAEPPIGAVLAGSGEFLGRLVLEQRPMPSHSLNDLLGETVSTAACAHAVAVLARERHP